LQSLIKFDNNNNNDGSSSAANSKQDYMKKQLLSFDPTGGDDEDLDNPIEYISELESKQRLQDVNNLRLLALCKECVVGINAIDIISGKNKLSIGISEFDLFDIFPAITGAGFSRKKDQSQSQSSKSTTEKKESMEEIFRRTSITRKK
jgi:hypothetical protein